MINVGGAVHGQMVLDRIRKEAVQTTGEPVSKQPFSMVSAVVPGSRLLIELLSWLSSMMDCNLEAKLILVILFIIATERKLRYQMTNH